MTGTINQDGGSQNAYMSTALCSGTRGGKKYLRKFRGGEGDTIWHETVQGRVVRWATGNTDAQEELSPAPLMVSVQEVRLHHSVLMVCALLMAIMDSLSGMMAAAHI